MTRTGKRRAAVLLALDAEGKSISQLCRDTGMKYRAVRAIADNLIVLNLADFAAGEGIKLGTSPSLASALAEARALLGEAEGVGA